MSQSQEGAQPPGSDQAAQTHPPSQQDPPQAAKQPDPAGQSGQAAEGTNQAAEGDETTSTGNGFIGRTWIIIIAVLMIAVAIIDLICIVQLWPTGAQGATSSAESHSILGFSTHLTPDQNLMLVVILAGVLGGILHSLRSIAWYVGERRLKWSWVLFYATLPVVGAILAFVFYLLIRGGIISPAGSTKDLNPYGVVAIAGLVGLFTSQAAEMLKNVFSTVFAKAPSGSDAAKGTENPVPSGSTDGVDGST